MSPQYRFCRYCGDVYFHRLRNQVRFALLGYVYRWIGKPEAIDFLRYEPVYELGASVCGKQTGRRILRDFACARDGA